MPGLAGRPGSWGGLVLRVGQAVCAGACVGVMGSSLGFASYTAFCYLLASMALQSLWSLGLACLDGYALKAKKDLTSPILVSLFLVGDWVTAILSFAASCSAAGVVILFKKDVHFCRRRRYTMLMHLQKNNLFKNARSEKPNCKHQCGSPALIIFSISDRDATSAAHYSMQAHAHVRPSKTGSLSAVDDTL